MIHIRANIPVSEWRTRKYLVNPGVYFDGIKIQNNDLMHVFSIGQVVRGPDGIALGRISEVHADAGTVVISAEAKAIDFIDIKFDFSLRSE